ncbi:MAG: ABC transporter ATP-binding protein/permease [Lachnospiraceae bacterium]|nr:ABC transporter ATP-binding protein/permease [Lachnospiraceae bacterium]
MLEVRNLCKTYRSKDGVSVEATKNISLRFPERGMVFLLGRSGSGKSTLLHLLGGLDRYDSGEILINGTSTREFTNSMMDSYRNTYVGFVFQDYNILPEFNVGANIALALELQGIKATNEKINEILEEVDLADYAKRKPNELSGGQLQRVAIARALIKDPDIILADEPTGALDSATGRQVFETLKKLSKRKLVIIVSHDRDYSEQYADRIIELADGCVISDVELAVSSEVAAEVAGDGTASSENAGSDGIVVFRPEDGIRADKDGLTLRECYELTEEDRVKINRFLELQKDNDVLLLEGTHLVPKKDRFRDTYQDAIIPEKTEFTLIKSKLPWKRSFGIGLNSLKHKKATLVFTVILSVVAFVLFGLADVFYSFNRIDCMADSVWESEVSYLTISKSYDSLSLNYSDEYSTYFSEDEIGEIEKLLGQKVVPVGNRVEYGGEIDYLTFKDPKGDRKAFRDRNEREEAIYPVDAEGIIEIDEERLDSFGAKLVAGRLPAQGANEVCISTLAAQSILKYGDRATFSGKTEADLVGMKLFNQNERSVTAPVICGILDFSINTERYERLISLDTLNLSDAERLLREVYISLCRSECANGLPAYLFCAVGSTDVVLMNDDHTFKIDEWISIRSEEDSEQDWMYGSAEKVAAFSDADPSRIIWLNGAKQSLGEKELLATPSSLLNLFRMKLRDIYGDDLYSDSIPARDVVGSMMDLVRESGNRLHVYIGDDTYDIVGLYIPLTDSSELLNYHTAFVVMNDDAARRLQEENEEQIMKLFCRMPDTKGKLRDLVVYGNKDEESPVHLMVNETTTMVIEEVDEVARVLTPVFKWIGIVFAAFSGVLFSVFITNSVIHKKQEIGVLRAVGARSLDVYRIFLSETGVIAVFNWFAASCLVYAIVTWINNSLRGDYLYDIVLLHFGVRQVLLIFAISIGIAIVATFLPIWGIARRKPIDVIRDR